jgi:GTP-binding protein
VGCDIEAYGYGLGDKPEIVALTKADALAPDQLKQQVANLKRAAKRDPLVISAVTGAGVPDALRKLLAVIDTAQADETREHPAPAWHPT